LEDIQYEKPMLNSSILARGLVARLGIKPSPISLTYELSWRCNLACGYCDRHTAMRDELQHDEIFQALSEFHALGMQITNLDGGEALLHRHIDEIVDWLVERHITVTMHSNGILVPSKIATVRKLSTIKISLDGPRENHDAMRGKGSYDKALIGAQAAKAAGVEVAFTCTVGRHNADTIETLIQMAEELEIPVIFQPAMNSLFLDSDRDGSAWQLESQFMRDTFARIENIKHRSNAVGNAWSSLRHFRTFPEDTKPPCAAGWVLATMDPEGVLFQCGQVNRKNRSNNVIELGAATAFANLNRDGCSQCWCARLVEGNYQWGMRVDMMLPPLRSKKTTAPVHSHEPSIKLPVLNPSEVVEEPLAPVGTTDSE
jgi:MoaA/NifB/PqqE/SkfB family radical SAM enzyme